jgi:hypothetical protein
MIVISDSLEMLSCNFITLYSLERPYLDYELSVVEVH